MANMAGLSYAQLALTAAVLILGYTIYVAVYRLYLSPIAKVPGPKLAALTLWYEFYYDVYLRGQYTFKIRELHEQYGPIIRISPYEIHINDPDYLDELYAGPFRPRDKYLWKTKMFGNSTSFFGTVGHKVHRLRRKPVEPLFSKKSVTQLEPMLRGLVEKLCSRLQKAKTDGTPVNMRLAFAALAMDAVTDYSFATSYNCLEQEDWGRKWCDAIENITEQGHFSVQFPLVLKVVLAIPPAWVAKMDKHMSALVNFRLDMEKQAQIIMHGKADLTEKTHPTIFHELHQSPILPEQDRTLLHMVDEGQTLIAAGQVTTTHVLATMTYHVIANPTIHAKIKEELRNAMPTTVSFDKISVSDLENLPYLSAIVAEGFRLSYGVSHRLTRVAPYDTLTFHDNVNDKTYALPPGTPVGMTSVLVHENPTLFPSPRTFDPQRWLRADGTRDNKLDKYLLHFSKGTRGCIGQNLALAEIYLSLAAILNRFNLEPYETERADIDMAHDFISPGLRVGSPGLRVLVK